MNVRRQVSAGAALALALLAVSVDAATGTQVQERAPITAALDRPALIVPGAEHAVLLGAARAGTRLVVVGERGIVLLSDDEGGRWRQVPVPVSVTLTGVRFPDPLRGYAIGHGGVVLLSEDGGASWTRCLDGKAAAQIALAAATASGDPRAQRDAQRLLDDGADKPFLDLHFYDALHGVVIGAYGLAFATEDGGRSWVSMMPRLDNPRGLHLNTLRVRGDTLLIAGEQGLLLRSSDRGASFTALASPYKGSWFSAELPNSDGSEILLAGLRGNVWHSTDAGATWAALAVPTPATMIASTLLPGGDWMLADQSGALLRGHEGQIAPAGGTPPLAGLLVLDDAHLLGVGFAGVSLLPLAATPQHRAGP